MVLPAPEAWGKDVGIERLAGDPGARRGGQEGAVIPGGAAKATVMSPGPDPMETPEMSTEGLSRTVRLRARALPAGLPLGARAALHLGLGRHWEQSGGHRRGRWQGGGVGVLGGGGAAATDAARRQHWGGGVTQSLVPCAAPHGQPLELVAWASPTVRTYPPFTALSLTGFVFFF